MPPWDIGHMDQPHLIDVLLQLLNQVSEPPLLVIQVVQNLDPGTSHSPHDLKRLRNTVEIDRWVLQPVDWLDHPDQTRRIQKLCGPLQRLNRSSLLCSRRCRLNPLPRQKNDLPTPQPLHRWDKTLQLRNKRVSSCRIGKSSFDARGRVHRNLQRLHMSEDAGPIRLRPSRKLTDQLDMPVARLGDTLQVLLKGPSLIQCPHHHRKLWPRLLVTHVPIPRPRLAHQPARHSHTHSKNCGYQPSEGPSTQHAPHPNKVSNTRRPQTIVRFRKIILDQVSKTHPTPLRNFLLSSWAFIV